MPSSRLNPLALAAVAALSAGSAWAAGPDADQPVKIEARTISGTVDDEARAEGDVELRRGGLLLKADRLTYRTEGDRAVAEGRVSVSREGSTFRGPLLELQLQTFEGFFLQPDFDIGRTKTGGRAQRIDFAGTSRFQATQPIYSSCPLDGSGGPDWLLSARKLSVDLDANEGVAEGARLQFLGVPLLVLPRLSFPVTGERKSGWLPPEFRLDTRSGVTLGVPYYWNIAPNRDATLSPRVVTRRGAALDTELRYLEPDFQGRLWLDWMPSDRLTGRTRYALKAFHDGALPWSAGPTGGRYEWAVTRVSDDDWWKDFATGTLSWRPRLLPLLAAVEQPFVLSSMEAQAYVRTRRWQVLQSLTDPIASPYNRTLQAGVHGQGALPAGLEGEFELEFNRFDLPNVTGVAGIAGSSGSATRPNAHRLHLTGHLERPWRQPGGWLTPRLALNVAGYDLDQALPDGRQRLARAIPTFSLDGGLTFERSTTAFGRALRQTLEPRFLYVNTPWRQQSPYLAFDSAGKDFNFSSIYTGNEFSGVDRVSDANQLNVGAVTRLVDASTGGELMRLGVVQRLLFSDQRITPDGQPFTGRVSDLLLLGSTSVIPRWSLEGSLRWNAEDQAAVRSVVTARHDAGESRLLNATYRYNRGLTEQWEFGWLWPLRWSPGRAMPATAAPAPSSGCQRRWYSLGRMNYSVRDQRVTDALVGFEVDAGCWTSRLFVEQQATGRGLSTTRLMFQLELAGLSRSAAGPLRVLKDNMAGFRPMREDGLTTPTGTLP
ncbi:MAG: LPS assembly protein LptD [Betaproteobacteria bacterium]